MSQQFSINHYERLHILRDDLLIGGTKRRGLNVLLKDIQAADVFYAGTVMGHGALALAHACEDVGKRAHVFICGSGDNPMITKIRKTNAIIYLEDPMTTAMLHEKAVRECGNGCVLPPGFDIPEFERALMTALSSFDAKPYSEIWTTAVTGTFTRALKKCFPEKIFRTVSVVKSGIGDFTAPEKYHKAAISPPPYPRLPLCGCKAVAVRASSREAGSAHLEYRGIIFYGKGFPFAPPADLLYSCVMKQTREYKVVLYREGMLGSLFLGSSKVDPERFGDFLNRNAAEGWRVITMEKESRRMLLFFDREAFMVIMERDVG